MRTAALSLLILAACTVTTKTEEGDAPRLDSVMKVYDAQTGRCVDLDRALNALARNEVVFFGETHLDESTHRLELAVYEGLIERTGGRVVLAMEMFERDVQPALDEYLSGTIDEAAFLAKARPWGNYRTGYRALVETAKRHGLPVVASNAPAALRRKVGFGGPDAMDKLSPEERALLPEKLYPNSEAYWKRFASSVRGHSAMITQRTPEQQLTSGQSLWDNSMGESCARALDAHPGYVVLHVNGGFHSKFREGTVSQLLARRPATRVGIIEAVPFTDLPAVEEWKSPNRADFLAAVDSRARGVSRAFHAVTVAHELRYRVLMPKKLDGDVPLLVWLGDEAFRARDGLRLWHTALANEAAIVVVEPPFPHITDDLYLAGKWSWSETFDEDLAMVTNGLERVVEYVLRYYPIDRKRVLIAGEGTGAMHVAAAAVYGGIEFPMLAVAPVRYTGLRRKPLPTALDGTLTVVTDNREWWDTEAETHDGLGLTTTVVDAAESSWEVFVEAENRIRKALGLGARPAAKADAKVLVLGTDASRARRWAHLMARRTGASVVTGEAEGIPLRCLGEGDAHTFGPEGMQEGAGLPLATGPFGGTTVLLVPAGRSDEVKEAWEELETDDVINKRSRFAHLKVAFEDDEEDDLSAALQWVTDKGRSNVLVVPAVFCADAADLRRWAAVAKEFPDVDIAWLPGLGGSLRLPE